ncbi:MULTISPECIES: protease modulator HflC [unclassified Arsukibacterium]|uniref:protease modulator HflC n=1 Tax=unclassified Arsukibacterium TaxID=2635278 RepID=UPI000C5F388C|nr:MULTISPECIES: protease modulator HflC [unclassified Arsukibacterium]MAA93966.1 protease modulator HflC [Rheinheimera sp.]MBM33631.1 protease modulator HflC [Rheinheimera sp.]HAW92784.1 protease modulator HflC [Candidatus Azambacteria bacterium]|tara:strand:+ start:156371 stop:157252 length:882 start_codon:yes stop_codon:yes gene_type:complete
MKNFIIAIIVVVAIIVVSALFVVPEGKRAIVTQFGKIQRDDAGQVVVYEPGLHLKMPMIEVVRKLDSRIQTLDDQPDRFVTAEKKDLLVDSYVKWRIKDFGAYFLSTGGITSQAEVLLKQYINNGLRTEFGTRTIQEIVSGERTQLMESALAQAGAAANELGIEVIDVRVKQINLPTEVSSSIFARMRAERDAVAREHRSRGMEESDIIRADVDARVTIMLADAERNSRAVRGQGDAQAAKIYADVYSRNAEFYSFVRSLEAYKKSFNDKQDIMVVQPDNDFFKYMTSDKVQN